MATPSSAESAPAMGDTRRLCRSFLLESRFLCPRPPSIFLPRDGCALDNLELHTGEEMRAAGDSPVSCEEYLAIVWAMRDKFVDTAFFAG